MSQNSSEKSGTAIIAITRKGVELGRRLNLLLPSSCLHVPGKYAGDMKNVHVFSTPVKGVVEEEFSQCRQLILIMAVGAAVRMIAPVLRSKQHDPGIIVVDEAGTFAVSLLSGHAGGANELAKKVAHLLGAKSVVTTASDVSEIISADLLGKEFGWQLEKGDNLTKVAASLVNGEPVGIYQDAGEKNWWKQGKPLPANVQLFSNIASLKKASCKAAIVITDRVLTKTESLSPIPALIYRPKSLVVGIGCNRGTRPAEIENAVKSLFSEHGLSIISIRNITTIDIKADEAGLLEFADQRSLSLDYFTKETLSKIKCPSRPSQTVLKNVGTPSVCESAAIASSGNPALIIPKTNYGRAISLAVARLLSEDGSLPGKGKLFLVGIGPGNVENMTFRARERIDSSEAIVGYSRYINLVQPLIGEKEIHSTGMTQEIQRARLAIDLACQGKTVSIVCGGDSGVYGMAGLVIEMLSEQDKKLEVEVVPGVPAAIAVAALLGAPLTGDFACISLSDYLVPWSEIDTRLRQAAQAGFVIVIYNPRSKKRQSHLAKAQEILLKYLPDTTPVGIVNNAFREGQKKTITDLRAMCDHEIDMNTTIIIGNSSTYSFNGWMVTPRGYSTKYELKEEAFK